MTGFEMDVLTFLGESEDVPNESKQCEKDCEDCDWVTCMKEVMNSES